MRRVVHPDVAATMIMPSDAIPGATVNANKDAGNKWKVRDNAGNSEIALGVDPEIDGSLVVHGINSWNHNTERNEWNKVWTTLKCKAGVPKSFEFDEIDVASSTAGLFNAGNMLILL